MYNYFTHASNNMLSRQLMNKKNISSRPNRLFIQILISCISTFPFNPFFKKNKKHSLSESYLYLALKDINKEIILSVT